MGVTHSEPTVWCTAAVSRPWPPVAACGSEESHEEKSPPGQAEKESGGLHAALVPPVSLRVACPSHAVRRPARGAWGVPSQ